MNQPYLNILKKNFIFVKHSQHGLNFMSRVSLKMLNTNPKKTEAKTCCQSISPVCADVGYI